MLESSKAKEGGKKKAPPPQTKLKPLSKTLGKTESEPDGNIDVCKEEIEALEREIKLMGAASSSEAEIVKREVQILKKYCIKLISLQKENADLRKERDMWKNSLLSTADSALKEKMFKLEEIIQEKERLKSRIQQLERSAKSLPPGDSSEKKSQDSSSIRQRLDVTQGLGDEGKKSKDTVRATHSGGDAGDKAKLLQKIATLEEELMKAHATNKNLRDKSEHLKSLLEENDVLRKHQKTKENKLESTNKIVTKTGQELKDMGEEMKKLLSRKEQQIQDKEKVIEVLTKESNHLNQQLEAEKKRVEQTESMLKKVTDDDSAEISVLTAQLNVVKAETDRLNFDLENQKQECEETLKRLNDRIKQSEADEKEIQRLEQANEELNTDVERLKKENNLLRKEITKLNERGERSSLELEKQKVKIVKLQEEIDTLRQELLSKEYVENKNKRLREEIAELQNDIERLKKEGEVLKIELQKVKLRERSNSDIDTCGSKSQSQSSSGTTRK